MTLMITLDDVMAVLDRKGYFDEFDGEDAKREREFVRSEFTQKCYAICDSGHPKFLTEDINEVTDISNIADQIKLGRLNDWLEIKRDNMLGMLELITREGKGRA